MHRAMLSHMVIASAYIADSLAEKVPPGALLGLLGEVEGRGRARGRRGRR
jgi:hypothetical protein